MKRKWKIQSAIASRRRSHLSLRGLRAKRRGRSNLILVLLALLCTAVFSGCGGMVPKNFTFDTSNHQTNPQLLLGVDITFDPQINVSNTNDNSSSASNSNTSSPVVTTSDTTTNTSTGGASTNTNTASTVK